MTYHVAYFTNDVESHLYGDIAIHEGPGDECNRCAMSYTGVRIEGKDNGTTEA